MAMVLTTLLESLKLACSDDLIYASELPAC